MGGALSDLQRFVLEGVAATTAVEDTPGRAAAAERLIAPSPRGIAPAGRLEIYREQFWLRHLANLREDFPTLAWALGGRAAFEGLATEYLVAHPPRTWDLQRLGASMEAFVGARGAGLALDACRLDWAFVAIFDAPDAPPLDLRAVAEAPEDAWPGARLRLHPAVRLVELGHPVHEVRPAVRAGETPPPPAPGAVHVVVWRDPGFRLHATAIEGPAFRLLGALAAGETLGAACEAAAAGGTPDVQDRVGAWFQSWTASGWVSEVLLGA